MVIGFQTGIKLVGVNNMRPVELSDPHMCSCDGDIEDESSIGLSAEHEVRTVHDLLGHG